MFMQSLRNVNDITPTLRDIALNNEHYKTEISKNIKEKEQ